MKTPDLKKIVLSLILVPACADLLAQNCQAGFSFTVNQNVVVFTNTSTGASMPVYYWSFGDGNYSYAANPTNTYQFSGTYYVCLTLWDSLSFNCQSTYCDTVVITNAPPQPCNAYFYWYPDSLSNSVYFYDYTTNNPIAWSWSFPGGSPSTSTMQNPVVNYANPGTYLVCLTAYTQTDTCTYCDSINYYPCNLTAGFTMNTSADPTVVFINTSTGGYAPSWMWNFGDGNYAYTQNASNTYLYNGTYYVCLTVWDSLATNCASTYCDSVIISNGQSVPCNANYVSWNDSTNNGLVYFYDISTGGPFYSWYWDFGDGNTSTQQNPTHTYAQTGWYQICLTVFSQTNTCTNCDSIYVLNLSGIEEWLSSGAVNYFPNPTNGMTTIAYTLNGGAAVSIEVYDLVGNKVETILDQTRQEAGSHTLNWNAGEQAEGIYLLRITVNGHMATGKLTVIK